MSSSFGRINLALPLETMIQIEKECDKRGTNRTQFVKEAVHEKLRNLNTRDEESDIKLIKEEIHELKKIVLLLVDKN